MKTYLRLLSYAKPFEKFALPYAFASLFSIIFGLLNFSLLIPVLDLLFNASNTKKILPAQRPEFSFSIDYFSSFFDYILGRQIQNHGQIGALWLVCGILVASVFLSNAFKYYSVLITESLRAYLVRNLRKHVFERMSNLHLGFFNNERKGDIISRIMTDVQEVEGSVANTLSVLFREPVAIIGYFVVLVRISPQLTLFTLIIIPISGLFISIITRHLRRTAVQGQQSLANLMSMLDETIGGIRVVKAFNAEAWIRSRFQAENERYTMLARKTASRRELASPFSEFMGVFVVAAILLYGGSMVLENQSGALRASEFIAYVVLFSQVMRPAKSMSSAFGNIQRGLVSGERVFTLIDAPVLQTSPANAVQIQTFNHSIRFDNVSFAYQEKQVLSQISFELTKGSTIALVGGSGGGKSTIADLVPRFYDPSEGSIFIDDNDLKTLDTSSLRALMGIVSQESVLFNDTIFNNIAFGNPLASPQAVHEAARIAYAHDFVMLMPDGYQTMVGDRGVRLSGGQRQRLSIARAILKNPPILLLDEATSALDTESEKMVQQALAALMANRTTLIIAHRLSTIQAADQILVLDQGRIIERGNHQQLLSQYPKGMYARLWNMQMASES